MRAFSSDILSVSSILNDPLEFSNKEESRSVLNNKLEHFYDMKYIFYNSLSLCVKTDTGSKRISRLSTLHKIHVVILLMFNVLLVPIFCTFEISDATIKMNLAS